jgi:DNA polymerase III epsilon subunit-like protein
MNLPLEKSSSILAQGQPDLPNTYVALKVRTTGLEPDDLIVQICHLVVEDGQVTESASPLLACHRHPGGVSAAWLEQRLANVPERQRTPFQDIDQRGEEPATVLRRYHELFTNLARGTSVVGHNVLGFDLLWLRRHLIEWAGMDLDVGGLDVWDVGLAELARALGVRPEAGERRTEFFDRVKDQYMPRVPWNLDHCLRLYGINVNLEPYDPLYGVSAVHLVYQAQRGRPAERPAGHLDRERPALA